MIFYQASTQQKNYKGCTKFETIYCLIMSNVPPITQLINMDTDVKNATQELGINHTRVCSGRRSLFFGGTCPLSLMGGVPVVFPPVACDVPMVQHLFRFWYQRGSTKQDRSFN